MEHLLNNDGDGIISSIILAMTATPQGIAQTIRRKKRIVTTENPTRKTMMVLFHLTRQGMTQTMTELSHLTLHTAMAYTHQATIQTTPMRTQGIEKTMKVTIPAGKDRKKMLMPWVPTNSHPGPPHQT